MEAQWYASRGDKLLREMLVSNHFKAGTIDSLGGWQFYITNVIKAADYAKAWRKKSVSVRRLAAEAWAAVLQWELEQSKPFHGRSSPR